MVRVYDEIIEFIAAGPTPEMVAEFEASQQTKIHVAELVQREKLSNLSAEEASELDHFMQLEHIMRLTKASARSHCSN